MPRLHRFEPLSPTQVTDALGRVALTVYDVFGQIQQVTHPDGSVVSTDYTHHGKPWKVVDELGNVTTTEFDAAGRAVRSIAPAIGGVSATTSTGYDAAGNVVRVTDPLGHVTESQYDERNRVVAVYAPPVWDAVSGEFVRPVTRSTYDALGQVVTVTDPQGHVTTKLYDRAGRNWKVIAPMVGSQSPMTRTKFDPGGLALVVTNPLGQSVTNTYDVHGRLTQTTDAMGIVNTFAYDAVGNRTSVVDGLGSETTFGYDGLNRLSWQVFANGDTTTHVYDAVRKLSQTTPRGITTSYTYDSRDRVVGSSAPGITRTHAYDAAGHLLSVTEAENPAASVAYTYDALGRVTSETSQGVTHSYGYDLAGNRVRADYGTGRTVLTSYDALNRPESIVEGGRATGYGYDLAGRAVMLVAGNGQTAQNSYDALGRLVARTLFKTPAMGESEVLAEFNWTHDLLGNVTQQLETWPGDASRSAGVRSTTMTYDADNRLASETVVEPTAGVTTTNYTYDAANNRLQKTVTGGSDPGVWHYLYNAVNQLMSWEQRDVQDSVVIKSATLAYDEAGNRVSQTVSNTSGSGINPPPAAGGTTSYQWDAQDRLSSVTLPNGETHAYEYDYRTRRIGTQKFAGAVRQSLTAIVFAGGLSVAEFDTTTDTLPDNPTVEYTRGPDMGGGVGGMLYSLRGGNAKYSLSNGRGDIVGQADQGATLTWTASYEAYGRRTVETGENQDKQRANTKDEDPTGLLNEGFRYRDLETGVWLSRDPAGFVDGPNVYAYVKQNPWTAFDPHGLSAEDYFDGVCDIWKGYGDVTIGAVASIGHAVWDLPKNACQFVEIASEAYHMPTGILLQAESNRYEAIKEEVAAGVTAYGQRLANGDNRAWGQTIGTALTIAGPKGAQCAESFMLGVREGQAIKAATELAKTTSAGGVTEGAVNVMIAADGRMFKGLSEGAGGGPVSGPVQNMYGSAKVTCSEGRTLTAMVEAEVNLKGAVSASASVGVKGLKPGTPMTACANPKGRAACAPVLKNAGIGDAVAGTSPTPARVKTPVPVKVTTEDEKK